MVQFALRNHRRRVSMLSTTALPECYIPIISNALAVFRRRWCNGVCSFRFIIICSHRTIAGKMIYEMDQRGVTFALIIRHFVIADT
jgi:hypothetical protein